MPRPNSQSRRPDPIQPSQQDRDRAWIVPQAVASAREQAQLGGAVGLREHAGIGNRDVVIVLAVHHQHRARGEPAGRGAGAEPAEGA